MKDGDVTVAAPVAAPPAPPAPSDDRPPPIAASASDRSIVPGTASERHAAVGEMMEAHGDAVFGFCMRMVRARDLAEDVTQQVFLEAYRDLDQFEGRSSQRSWLLGIAIHRCMDTFKQRQRMKLIESNEQAVLDFEDPAAGPIADVDRARLAAALDDCLARLSPDVRATVLLRFQTEATYEDLAIPLAANPYTLQIRVSRALPILRRCMERKGWTGG